MTRILSNKCDWHKDDKPIHPSMGCQDCGSLYTTRYCGNCRKLFLDWDSKCLDDVIAGPYVTESGDLKCMRCGPGCDERESDDDEFSYLEDYPL